MKKKFFFSKKKKKSETYLLIVPGLYVQNKKSKIPNTMPKNLLYFQAYTVYYSNIQNS